MSLWTVSGNPANLLTDSPYHLIIQQRSETIQHLSTQWATPLVSSDRYDSHAHEAIKLAETLSGQPSTTVEDLQWHPPVVCHIPSAADPDDDLDEEYEHPEDPADTALTPEAVVLGDLMDGGDNEEEESSDQPTVHFHWQLPEVSSSLSRPESSQFHMRRHYLSTQIQFRRRNRRRNQ